MWHLLSGLLHTAMALCMLKIAGRAAKDHQAASQLLLLMGPEHVKQQQRIHRGMQVLALVMAVFNGAAAVWHLWR